MEDWVAELHRGRFDASWDLFLDRYRRVIFAAIRHYANDHDDVMDVFARACDVLREGDLRRLRARADQTDQRASTATWLVTVIHHVAIDWYRHRDGRRRPCVAAHALTPLRRRIYEHVFLDQRSHVETYELIRAHDAAPFSFRYFLSELRATYHTVTEGRRGGLLRELDRRTPAEVELSPDEADPRTSNDDDGTERRELLDIALEGLSPAERVALELYVLDELPAVDVARVLGLSSAKAVYNCVYRALAAVRANLEKAGIRRGDL